MLLREEAIEAHMLPSLVARTDVCGTANGGEEQDPAKCAHRLASVCRRMTRWLVRVASLISSTTLSDVRATRP